MMSVQRSLQHYFSLKVGNEKVILKMTKEQLYSFLLEASGATRRELPLA